MFVIIGIGIDIVSINRMSNLCNKHPKVIHRLFTEKEIEYFQQKNNSIETISAFFATKEAVSKALGTGFRKFSMKDIEVNHDPLGKPYVSFLGEASKVANQKKIGNVQISISHERDNAVAICIVE